MSNILDYGSEWNQWDLHVHTASSYDYKFKDETSDELLVKAWRDNGISAVAITDHFLIDSERIKNLRSIANNEIVIFPGVELRTDKGDSNIHLILIFDCDMDLDILQQDFESRMLRDKAKPDNYTNENVFWDYNDIIKFAKDKNAIISIHAGSKSNGIDKCITNKIPVNQAIKADYASNIDIFEVGKEENITDYKNQVFKHISPRPIIICSDNHDPRNYELKEKLWIKAQKTFAGLKHSIIHSSERVYVGTLPQKCQNIMNNPEKNIKYIEVRKNESAKNQKLWFDFKIPLSSGLTTIIGNKGSGKSALADIIGYLGKSGNYSYFSFLNKSRFGREDKQYNLDYNGCLKWLDDAETKSSNFELKDEDDVEIVKYLPQSFIEATCNNLDGNFQKEIDKVIFSYIENSDKEKLESLDELIEKKFTNVSIEENKLRVQLSELNESIVKLETKKTKTYKTEVIKRLDYYKGELERHKSNKPKEIKKPIETTTEQGLQFIKELNNDILNYERQIEINTEKAIKLKNDITTLQNFQNEVKEIINNIDVTKEEIDTLNKTYSFNPLVKLEYQFDLSGVEQKISEKNDELKKISVLLNKYEFNNLEYTISDKTTKMDEDLQKSTSLYGKINILNARITRVRELLSLPEKKYQDYLERLKIWENKEKSLVGTAENVESFTYWSIQSEYLSNHLDIELDNLYKERLDIIDSLFDLITEKKDILDGIYKPVEKKLSEILSNLDDKITFEARPNISNEFINDFLGKIHQNIQSKFKGKKDGREYIESLLRKYDCTKKSDTLKFVNEIFIELTEDYDKSENLMFNKKLCYDYLFGLSYFHVGFSLKMGLKELSQLSPGEKGNVLLIFYLALDKNNIPLIIDQPEDNLDNQSIYSKLVPCVLEAKKNRQVILVTHNPNLAMACDSELIIFSEKIEQLEINNNDVIIQYTYGAIENNKIKNFLVDVLEGTQPAFDLRRDKYETNTYN